VNELSTKPRQILRVRRRILMVAISMLAGSGACAADWSLEVGAVGGDGARGLIADAPDYYGIKMDARLGGEIGPGRVSLRAAADFEIGSTENARGNVQELQELVYVWNWDRWEFALGRQRLQWGRADGINPSDVWTPRSFDRPTLVDPDQYRGADTLQATLRVDESKRLSLLVLPHFRPSELGQGLFADLPLPVQSSDAVDVHRPGWGLRYEATGKALDYSITAVDSAELLPYFRLENASELTARYGRLRMLATDAAYGFGSWVVRGEAAWRQREEDDLHLAPATAFDAIVGVEREIVQSLVVNFQYFVTEFRSVLPDVTGPTGALGLLNRGTFHQQRNSYTGATLSLNLLPADQLSEFNASYAAYASGEHYLRLRAKYSLFDRYSLGALLERYDGPYGSTFDLLRRNNVAWLFLNVSLGNR